MSDQIHIRSVYLQSIEDEDWGAIAAPVYVRGFIRTYARFLGLDPEAAVEAYNDDMEAVEREADGPVRVAPARRRGPSLWIWLAGAAAVILLCFVGYSYYQLQTGGVAAAPDAAASGSAVAESPEPAASEAAAVAQASGSPEAVPSEAPGTAAALKTPLSSPGLGAAANAGNAEPGVGDLVSTPSPAPSATLAPSLKVLVTDRAWVRVDIDGRRQMEGIYPAGTAKSFQGGKSAYVRTGNAGGVDLVVNGKNLGKMGPGGEVIEKTLPLGEE